MNRRILVPLVLAGGVVGLGVLLQLTGQFAGGSATGAATGTASTGCAGGGAGVVADEDLAGVRAGTAPAATPEVAQRRPVRSDADVVAGEYLVKLRTDRVPTMNDDTIVTGDPELDRLFSDLSGLALTTLGSTAQAAGDRHPVDALYRLSGDIDLGTLQGTLYGSDAVAWIEPVYVTAPAAVPDDPLYPLQWNLDSLAVPSVHDLTVGQGITVAILDSGFVPGPDGVPNLAPGLDYVDADADRTPNGSHGTHITSLIAQSTNNSVGGAGLAPGVTVLPIRILGWDEQRQQVVGRSDQLAEAITWAADHGAAVIHMSVTSPRFSKAVADACDYAYAQGVTLVAAAGNGGFTDHIDFPAALPSVIAVGATDLNHEVPAYANQGRDLELVAPGGSLLADTDGDGQLDGIGAETLIDGGHSFVLVQGTSQAAAHVTAAAALLRSVGVNDPNEVRSLLQASAHDLGQEGPDEVSGHGELSIQGALQLHQELSAQPEPGKPTQTEALVEPLGEDRAVIHWLTSEPMTTGVEDDEGVLMENTELRTAHAVLLRGEPGEELRVLIFSENEADVRLDQEVAILFGSGPEPDTAAP